MPMPGATAVATRPTVTPSVATKGPTACVAAGALSCSTTPSAGAVTGVTVWTAWVTTLNVLAAVDEASELPPGVVTSTVLAPVAAPAAICTTAGSVPPAALATVDAPPRRPAGGTNATDCASCRLLPRTVSVRSAALVPKIGSIEKICGAGRTTSIRSAPGEAAANAPAGPVRTTLRGEIGALAATVRGTEAEVPSGATAIAPSLMPGSGPTPPSVAACHP